MADIRKLYIEFIEMLDPYEDIEPHKSLSINGMLYNLMEIKKNWDIEPAAPEYNRLNTLIELFSILKN